LSYKCTIMVRMGLLPHKEAVDIFYDKEIAAVMRRRVEKLRCPDCHNPLEKSTHTDLYRGKPEHRLEQYTCGCVKEWYNFQTLEMQWQELRSLF